MSKNGYSLLISNIFYLFLNMGGLYFYAESNFDHSKGLLLLMLTFLGMVYIICNAVVLVAYFRINKKTKVLKCVNSINTVLTVISLIMFGYTFYAVWFANYYDILWLRKFFGI